MIPKEGLKGYRRSLFTYLPIVFFIITVIASISFLVINDISSKQAHQANKVFTSYIQDTIDSRLLETERSIVTDVASNPAIQKFLSSPDASQAESYDYPVSEEIRRILGRNALVDSIELLRFADQLVITSSGRQYLDNFADRDYAVSRMNQPSSISWSTPRKLTDRITGRDYWVLSMTKQAPIPFGDQGMVLIHINLSSLISTIDSLQNNITYIQIWNSEQMLYPYSEVAADDSRTARESKVITSMTSPYSGLTLKSGLKQAVILGWVSVLTYIWIGAGVILIVLGILLMIYMSKRNYRPIEQIVRQIHQYQIRTPMDGSGDEFSFIHRAIEQLVRQTETYEKERQGDLVIRRQQFFQELVEGKRLITLREWVEGMKQFQLKSRFSLITFVLIEIDDYREFCDRYSVRDQSLLKFALANVMMEMAVHRGCSLWGEWMHGHRFGVLIYHEDAALQKHRDTVVALCEQLGAWVKKNLRFTLSAGIGHSADTLERIPALFEDAQYALKYKLALGADRIFDIAHLRHDEDSGSYNYLHMVREIIEGFRLNDQWKEQLQRMFGAWRSQPLPEDEIRNLVHYLLYLFSQSVEALPGDLPYYWNDQLLPALNKDLEQAGNLERIEQALSHGLFEMYDAFQLQVGARSQHSMIKEIRSYIELHYTDPNLSLKDISDRYEASGKYVSQLFKEEFGEKFVDFLVHLRMEHAKQLLVATDDPLPDIASAVGYTNPISFGRTFKKHVGVTPMDYRKMMSTA